MKTKMKKELIEKEEALQQPKPIIEGKTKTTRLGDIVPKKAGYEEVLKELESIYQFKKALNQLNLIYSTAQANFAEKMKTVV